jgi:hypothetical protein
MSNNGCRIVLDRHEGNRWAWHLTVFGEKHNSRRSEVNPAKAAEAADMQLAHVLT